MNIDSPARAWPKVCLIVLSGLVAACDRPASEDLQGYVEGEYVYIASLAAGALDTLAVERGAQVQAGDLLFDLESGAERAGRTLAAQHLDEGKARLAADHGTALFSSFPDTHSGARSFG